MEKNENEELLEQSPAEIQQEDTQEIAKSGEVEADTEEQKDILSLVHSIF